jgi:peroxiredoxin/rubrerythrin
MRKPIKVGHRLPDFVLKDQDGNDVRREGFSGQKVLLSFHPLAWTGICSKQMKSLETNYRTLGRLNTIPLGVSVDTVPSKKAWAKALGIKKTRLLADFWPHGELARKLGLFRLKQGFSERANVIVDEKQRAIFVRVYPIRELPDIREIIAFLRGKSKRGVDVDRMLKAAMESEAKAQRFYSNAAARAESDAGRKFFAEMAEFEHFHYVNIKGMIEARNRAGGLRLTGTKPRLGEVRSEVQGEFEPNKNEITNLVILAIKAEKDAQERYKRLARTIGDPEGETIFNGLAHDEFRHQRLLEDQLYQLSNQGTIIWE